MDIIEILKQFGFPIAAAVVVGYAYWRATTDRIKKLESITSKQGSTIEELQQDRLDRAEKYAGVLRDISMKLGGAMREQSQVLREQHVVLKAAIDAINSRPCMSINDKPTQTFTPPSSDDLPVPAVRAGEGTDLFPTAAKPDTTDL